jgi:hypothetical protein
MSALPTLSVRQPSRAVRSTFAGSAWLPEAGWAAVTGPGGRGRCPSDLADGCTLVPRRAPSSRRSVGTDRQRCGTLGRSWSAYSAPGTVTCRPGPTRAQWTGHA